MNIVLIELALSINVVPGFNEFEEPLGLCYIGAAAKLAGHDVKLIQQIYENDDEKSQYFP